MIKEIPEKPDYAVIVTKLRGQVERRLLVEIIDTDINAPDVLSTYELSFQGPKADGNDQILNE